MNKLKKIAIAGLTAGLIFGNLANVSFATSPNWTLNAPSALTFNCGGTDYAHTLNTVSENPTTGDFTGTGTYNPDNSYTWNITGNVSGDNITFQLVYTGTNAGYTLNGTGTIASDGSISGTTDGNCSTFSMPAGSATAAASCPAGTTKSALLDTVSVNSSSSTSTPSNISLSNGTTYLLVSSGTWQNNNLNVADTEYASTDNWSTHMDGYDINPYFLGQGEFDLKVNNNFVNWGAYSSSHSYNYLYTGTGSPVNLMVFDGDSNTNTQNTGWYGDNVGSLTVNIYACNSNVTPTPSTTPGPGDKCKNNGWKTLTDGQGHTFKNQGDCVSFFATKGRNLGAGQ